jgi:hypothetical protein
MPFNLSTPSDVATAIADLADFYENTMEWNVTYDALDNTALISIPGRSATFFLEVIPFSYSNSNFGDVDFEILQITVGGVPTGWSTRLGWLNPITKMHVHADDTAEPWSLITFESAPGYFHHAFIGYMEKLGTYDGGAIADATGWPGFWGTFGSEWQWDNENTHLLFDGQYEESEDGSWGRGSGGIEVTHADAGADFYKFSNSNGSFNCGGGWGNGHNGTLAWVEPVGVDGSLNIHPVIIHANLNANNYITPVGCVPGVRMVNCAPFELGQVVSIGGQDWQIFPMCNKDVAYGETGGDGSGPGNIQPNSIGDYRLNIGGATERWGIAVLHEA